MKAALLAFATVCACAGSTPAPEKPAKELVVVPTPVGVVQAGKQIVELYKQAYAMRSADGLIQLYEPSIDLVVTHQGRAHHGFADVQTYVNTLLGRAKQIHIKVSNVLVAALGSEGAVVRADVVRDISDGTTSITEKGLLSLTLRRVEDKWRIIDEHFSFSPLGP